MNLEQRTPMRLAFAALLVGLVNAWIALIDPAFGSALWPATIAGLLLHAVFRLLRC